MRRPAAAGDRLLSGRKSARPAPKLARADDYGFARQLEFCAMRPSIEQAVGWDEYRMDMHFARQWNLGEVRIIAVSNRDIGWLQLRPCREATALLNLFLLSGYRARGIGGAILRQLLAQATRREKNVKLSVMKRDRALGFYRRHGFAIVDESARELTLRFEPKPALRGIDPSMGMPGMKSR